MTEKVNHTKLNAGKTVKTTKKCSCCGTRKVGVERGLSRLCVKCWQSDESNYNCCSI